MAGEWKETALGDVIELKRGYDLPQQQRMPGRVPLVSSSGVTDYHAVAMVKGPGVVTGRYGTLGQVFFVPDDFWPLNTTLYVRDFKSNDPRFISYFLRGLNFLAYSDKAAVPGLNRNHLHEARVRLPSDISEQRAIAHILGTLDDKIELNRRMNETLEAMARVLFKSWFVDFDPVRAKAEGRDPGLPQPIADLFPDRFEGSELGEIPAGWEVKTWGDLVILEYGKSLREYDGSAGVYPVYGTNGRIGYHSKPLCTHPGIIIGRKGAYRGVHFCSEPFFVIDTAFYVEPRKSIDLRWAYYELLRRDINSMDSGLLATFGEAGAAQYAVLLSPRRHPLLFSTCPRPPFYSAPWRVMCLGDTGREAWPQPWQCTALRCSGLHGRLCGLLRALRMALRMAWGQEEAAAQQIKACPAKHLALDQL